MAPAPQNGHSQRGATLVGWQTAVMVLAAFVVGLLPYIITQSKWASKAETSIVNDRVNAIGERIAAIDAEQLAQDADREQLRDRIDQLEEQIRILSGVYGPTAGSPSTLGRE